MLKFEAHFPPLLALVVLFASIQFETCHGIDFHRTTTGIVFSPYVHNKKLDKDSKSYSLKDVKTMMQVMSTRVSKIATFGVGALDVPYKWNETYYKSNASVYSGEAAALINKERSLSNSNERNPPITMILGIWLHNSPEQLDTEVQLALESAKKANSIWNGTVQGLVLTRNDLDTNLNRSRQALEQLKRLESDLDVGKLGLKLGTRQKCTGLGDKAEEDDEHLVIRKGIVKQSDFIICEVEPGQSGLGARAAFGGVKAKFSAHARELKNLNSKIEVMGQTGYPGKGNLTHEVDDLKVYWQSADEWAATQTNFTLWMMEAFDNPWKKSDQKAAHLGWWRLKDDSQTGKFEGYEEKITIQGRASPTSNANRHSNNSNTNTRTTADKNKRSGSGKINSLNYYIIILEIFAVIVLTMSNQRQ